MDVCVAYIPACIYLNTRHWLYRFISMHGGAMLMLLEYWCLGLRLGSESGFYWLGLFLDMVLPRAVHGGEGCWAEARATRARACAEVRARAWADG